MGSTEAACGRLSCFPESHPVCYQRSVIRSTMRRMKRSAGVTVIAVLSLLGSILLLAMGSLMIVARVLVGRSTMHGEPQNEAMAKFGMAFAVVLFLILAAWGISSAIGLFKLKQWARISTLIFSTMLAFLGVITPLFLLAIPMPPAPGTDPAIMAGVKIGISIFYGCLAAIGIWWLIYLTRARVVEQFRSGKIPGPPPKRPLSVTIIAWFLIVSSGSFPLLLLMHMPLLAFGAVLTGWKASLLLLAFCATAILSGIGLLQLRIYGLWLAIVYFIFGTVNSLVSYLLPGWEQRVSRMMDAMPSVFHPPNTQFPNPMAMAFIMIPFAAIPIYFLLKNKKAFSDAELPTTSGSA